LTNLSVDKATVQDHSCRERLAPTTAKRPLRLGIIVDSVDIAAWMAKALQALLASPTVEIVLLIRIDRSHMVTKSDNYVHGASLLYRLYRRLDDKLFRSRVDAFAPVSLASVLSAPVSVEVKAHWNGQYETFEEAALREIQRHELDVALELSSRSLGGEALTIARYGVWSHLFAEPLGWRGGPSGFWEVMETRPVTGAALVSRTQDSDPFNVLCRSYSATDKWSVRRNNEKVAWKTSSFALRKLSQLHEENGRNFLSDPVDNMESCFTPHSSPPDNITMVKLLAKHGWRYLRHSLHHLHCLDQWVLYYQITDNTSAYPVGLTNFNVILPPKERIYADPFCVERDGRYFIFFEEQAHNQSGVISFIEMSSDGRYGIPEVILKRDYHLSYPFIFSYGGEQFLVPESAENRTVELYRCSSWPGQWEPVEVMLQDVEAVDTTIEKIGDAYWMFVTMLSSQEAAGWDELFLFYADTPFGPWTPHRRNPIKSDARSARSAGRLFQYQGRLYRPSQDCSVRYGYGVVINEVEKITKSEYQEREVHRIFPNEGQGVLATHTLNRAGRLTVMDGRIARRRLF
jgi:hypothetical protein